MTNKVKTVTGRGWKIRNAAVSDVNYERNQGHEMLLPQIKALWMALQIEDNHRIAAIEAVAGGGRGIDFGAKNFSFLPGIVFLFGHVTVTLVIY